MSSPCKDSKVLFELPPYIKLSILEESKSWFKSWYKCNYKINTTGWLGKKWIDKNHTKYPVDLLSKPNFNSEVLSELPKGSEFIILENQTDSNWCHVNYKFDITGWVESRVLDTKENIEKYKAKLRKKEAELRKREVLKKKKQAKNRITLIRKQFSKWDGHHIKLVKFFKTVLNDPGSFEHVDTWYEDKDKYLVVHMTYRAKNAFGALMMGQVDVEVDLSGNIRRFIDE